MTTLTINGTYDSKTLARIGGTLMSIASRELELERHQDHLAKLRIELEAICGNTIGRQERDAKDKRALRLSTVREHEPVRQPIVAAKYRMWSGNNQWLNLCTSCERSSRFRNEKLESLASTQFFTACDVDCPAACDECGKQIPVCKGCWQQPPDAVTTPIATERVNPYKVAGAKPDGSIRLMCYRCANDSAYVVSTVVTPDELKAHPTCARCGRSFTQSTAQPNIEEATPEPIAYKLQRTDGTTFTACADCYDRELASNLTQGGSILDTYRYDRDLEQIICDVCESDLAMDADPDESSLPEAPPIGVLVNIAVNGDGLQHRLLCVPCSQKPLYQQAAVLEAITTMSQFVETAPFCFHCGRAFESIVQSFKAASTAKESPTSK